MNAGIGSREIEAAVREIELMGRDGHCTSLPREVLNFGYRELRGLAPGSVIVSALLEVEPSEPQQEVQVLDRQGAVEPELPAQERAIGLRSLLAEHQRRRIARQ